MPTPEGIRSGCRWQGDRYKHSIEYMMWVLHPTNPGTIKGKWWSHMPAPPCVVPLNWTVFGPPDFFPTLRHPWRFVESLRPNGFEDNPYVSGQICFRGYARIVWWALIAQVVVIVVVVVVVVVVVGFTLFSFFSLLNSLSTSVIQSHMVMAT